MAGKPQTLWDVSDQETIGSDDQFAQYCENYDVNNPEVWDMFKRFALEAIQTGRKRIGSRLIIERIRWETIIRAMGDDFKINNNMQPYYARKFMRMFPEHQGVFETRRGRM